MSETLRSAFEEWFDPCGIGIIGETDAKMEKIAWAAWQASIRAFLASPEMQMVRLKLDRAASFTRREMSGNDTHRLDEARCQLNEALAALDKLADDMKGKGV